MTLENFIYESTEEIMSGNYCSVKDRIVKHKDIYNDDTAICFSLLALGAFVDKQYDLAKQLLTDNKDMLEFIAKQLLEKETLDEKEFEELMKQVRIQRGEEIAEEENEENTVFENNITTVDEIIVEGTQGQTFDNWDNN